MIVEKSDDKFSTKTFTLLELPITLSQSILAISYKHATCEEFFILLVIIFL